MIDRLEELLAMLEDEDEREKKDEKDEEDREDVPALTGRTAPGAVPPEGDHGETAPAGDTRREAPAELNAGAPELTAGEPAEMEAPAPEEKIENGPVWRLDAGAAEAAWRRAPAERLDRPEEIAAQAARMAAEEAAESAEARLSVEKGGELARAVRHEAHSGLEGLYRQTVQAVRPAAQAPAPGGEPSGRTLRAGEPGRTAALTVDELDRAVRRDSRRYDGGMTIF